MRSRRTNRRELKTRIAALEAELDNRRHELDALVKREEYEEAAVCRDRINQLKTQLEGLATGEVGND